MDSGRAFYAGLLEALTKVMGSAKGYLHDHGPMVAMLASQLGRELGLSKTACSELVFAAVLSDMGMVGLAEDAWESPVATLSPEVRERVQRHPQRSEERVAKIPHLEELAPLIRHLNRNYRSGATLGALVAVGVITYGAALSVTARRSLVQLLHGYPR